MIYFVVHSTLNKKVDILSKRLGETQDCKETERSILTSSENAVPSILTSCEGAAPSILSSCEDAAPSILISCLTGL